MDQNDYVRSYISKVRASMKCPRKFKQRLLTEIEDDLWNALNQGNLPIESVETLFGSPVDIAESAVGKIDENELNAEIKKLHKRKIFFTTAGVVLFLAVLFLIFIISQQAELKMTTIVVDSGAVIIN